MAVRLVPSKIIKSDLGPLLSKVSQGLHSAMNFGIMFPDRSGYTANPLLLSVTSTPKPRFSCFWKNIKVEIEYQHLAYCPNLSLLSFRMVLLCFYTKLSNETTMIVGKTSGSQKCQKHLEAIQTILMCYSQEGSVNPRSCSRKYSRGATNSAARA